MNVQVGKTFAGQRQSSVNYIGEISRLVGVRSSRWAQTCGEPGYSTIRIGLPPTYTDQVLVSLTSPVYTYLNRYQQARPVQV